MKNDIFDFSKLVKKLKTYLVVGQNSRSTLYIMWSRLLFAVIFLFGINSSNASNQPCTGTGDQVTYGTGTWGGSGTWIGYVYNSTGTSSSFTNYVGYVNEPYSGDGTYPNFNNSWGGGSPPSGGCPSCISGGQNYSIRYKTAISSVPAGWYYITTGSDDGNRLSISTSSSSATGAASSNVYSPYCINTNFTSEGYTTSSTTIYWPGGTMYCVLEYFQLLFSLKL